VYYWKPEHMKNGCITSHGGVYKGAKIDMYRCVRGGNQRWYVHNILSQPGLQVYVIQPAANSGLCVDIPGGKYKKGVQPVLWTCHESLNQQFLMHCSSNQHHCILHPNKGSARKYVLSVRGASTRNNTPLILWKDKRVKDQMFTFSR
jgi:hypothetical protein